MGSESRKLVLRYSINQSSITSMPSWTRCSVESNLVPTRSHCSSCMNNVNAVRGENLWFILLYIVGWHLVRIERNIRHCSNYVHGMKIHNHKFQIKKKKCGQYLTLWKQLNFTLHNLHNVIKNVFWHWHSLSVTPVNTCTCLKKNNSHTKKEKPLPST